MWKFDGMARNLSGTVLQKKQDSRIQHSTMKQFTSIMQCPLTHNTAIVYSTDIPQIEICATGIFIKSCSLFAVAIAHQRDTGSYK